MLISWCPLQLSNVQHFVSQLIRARTSFELKCWVFPLQNWVCTFALQFVGQNGSVMIFLIFAALKRIVLTFSRLDMWLNLVRYMLYFVAISIDFHLDIYQFDHKTIKSCFKMLFKQKLKLHLSLSEGCIHWVYT